MTTDLKLSPTQQIVLALLKEGATINYFRGIGTRYAPSATVEQNGCLNKIVSVATVRSLRDKGLLEEYNRESYHSNYKLKTEKQ